MLDNLTERLSRVVKTLRGEARLTDANIQDALREVRLALLEADVALPVEVVAGKVKNERGEPIAIVSVLHDLTKQVENERLYDALKRLNSELEQRIRCDIFS